MADYELSTLPQQAPEGQKHGGFGFFVTSEIRYYVQKPLSPARICNRDLEDWLPTGFPSASRRGYRRLWGRGALRMEYMYTCQTHSYRAGASLSD